MTFKLYYFFFCPFLQNISNYHLPNSYHHITISYYHTSISYHHLPNYYHHITISYHHQIYYICQFCRWIISYIVSETKFQICYVETLNVKIGLYVYKSLMCTVYTWVSVLVGGGPGIILGH